MPRVAFDRLPPSARVWVFASERALTGSDRDRLLGAVDDHLRDWQAHGAPLTSAREWIEDRFLAVGVDPSTANASGCSIDALFRSLRALEPELHTRLVAGGTVFYRDADGVVHAVPRDEFTRLAGEGSIDLATHVFDTILQTAGAWRERFEIPASVSWHRSLLPDASVHPRRAPSR